MKEYSIVERNDQERFDKEFERMIDDGRYSILIVDQTQLAHINPTLAKKLKEDTLPVVVGIPDRDGKGETSKHLEEMIKKSLGIDIELKR